MMRSKETPAEWRWLYAALVLAFAAFFLFSVRATLTPLVAFILLVIVLAPYGGNPHHRTALVAASLALALWLLDVLGALLAPFVLAFVIAYILDPAVDALERRRVPRAAGVALLLAPLLVLLGLLAVFGLPALIHQLESLIARLPAAAAAVSGWIADLRAGAGRIRIPFLPADTLMQWLDEQRIAAWVAERQDVIAERAWDAFTGVGRGVGILLSILGYFVLTPVLVVYLLRDFNSITDRAAALLPEPRRPRWLAFAREYDHLLSRFLRGQVLAAAIVGVLTWIGLLIAGVPYAGLVGAIAGVFNLVPYLGLIVSVIPVIIIALLSGAFVATLVKAAIVFAIVQAIDGTVTGPRIVGESVGLHPVWVILALALGGAFFGFVGLLIAMPVAVLFKLLVREAITRYRGSTAFTGESVVVPGTVPARPE